MNGTNHKLLTARGARRRPPRLAPRRDAVVHELRERIVEPLAARLAAQRATQADLSRLRSHLSTAEAALQHALANRSATVAAFRDREQIDANTLSAS